ncbi:MAG TPA: hypothetical protein DCX06_07525 [Opitutae bacterium]|nr:hypothetical protein [Opitutae bacterium]
MKESEYRIAPYGRKWQIGGGVAYLILSLTYLNQIKPPVEWFGLTAWICLIVAGIFNIYDGLNSSQSLKISKGGIQITRKKKEWNANWEQFSIVEDDLVSFIIKFEKKEFRFVRKSLPEEVLELLKDRTEDLSSRVTQ